VGKSFTFKSLATVVRLVVLNQLDIKKKIYFFFIFYGNLNLSDDFLKNKNKIWAQMVKIGQ
jgi:hypothetical protein